MKVNVHAILKAIKRSVVPILILALLYLYEKSSIMQNAITSVGEADEWGVSILLLFALFALSVLYIIIKWHIVLLPKCENALGVFLIYVYVLSILCSFLNRFDSKAYYILVLLPWLMFYFSRGVSAGVRKKSRIVAAFSVMAVLMSLDYAKAYNVVHALAFDFSSNNSSYFLLYSLPFLMCVKNRPIRILLDVLVLIVIVSSFKRGTMIAYLLAVLVFCYMFYFKLRGQKIKAWQVAVVLIAICGGIFFVVSSDIYAVSHVIDRFSSIVDDKGSGRLEVYQATLNMIGQSNPLSLLLGHGWNRVIADSPIGLSAHNDFLECIYDFGLVGLVLFVRVFIWLWRCFKKLYRRKDYLAAPMAVSILIFFIGCMVSHIIIYPFYFVLLTLFWGFVSAQAIKKKPVIKK